MFKYIVRRTIYSLLVVFGVVVVTFLLFRVAGGDPAAVVLGKNPTPLEMERLRSEIGVDRPLFWGYWRQTERFTSAIFDGAKSLPGVEIRGGHRQEGEALLLEEGADLVFTRNFPFGAAPARATIRYRGDIEIQGESFSSGGWRTLHRKLDGDAAEFALAAAGGGAQIASVQWRLRQDSPWDSQLAASFAELASFRREFPYVNFLNFGRALVTREDIRALLWRGLWPSLALMVPIFVIELLLGIGVAMVATAGRGGAADRVVMVAAVAGMSVSYLVFIIFGQWLLGYQLNLFPVWGYGGVGHLALPVVIGVASGLGGGARFYRTVFVNELGREYLRAAKAKGCGWAGVYCKHLLGVAAVPIIARATTLLPFLFTGSLLLESFFGIPGLGYTGINALMNADLQLVKALVIIGSLVFVAVNLLADILYAWADPRVRLE